MFDPESNPASLRAVAAALRQARASGQLADNLPLQDAIRSPDDVLAVVQEMACDAGWLPANGIAPGYWKSGGPHRGGPLNHAPLPPTGIWHSPGDAASWPVFNLRGIEAEIALRISQDIDHATAQRITADNVNAFIDGMCVAIELVDSHWRDGLRTPVGLLQADYQSHSALVLGSWIAYEARNWATQTGHVDIQGQARKDFKGTHSLGDPAWHVPAWLQFVTRHWGKVQAGTVVTTGTWCGILQASAGDTVHVVFDGIGEACLQC